jgi:hypothetical protein
MTPNCPSARIGKAKAVTATARKISVLSYNAVGDKKIRKVELIAVACTEPDDLAHGIHEGRLTLRGKPHPLYSSP